MTLRMAGLKRKLTMKKKPLKEIKISQKKVKISNLERTEAVKRTKHKKIKIMAKSNQMRVPKNLTMASKKAIAKKSLMKIKS